MLTRATKALEVVLDTVAPLPPDRVPLAEVWGRRLELKKIKAMDYV